MFSLMGRVTKNEYICIHVLIIALRTSQVECPKEVIDIAMKKNKGPGRPKQAKGGQALLKK